MPVVDPRIAGKPVPRISKETMERDCVARAANVKALDVAFLDQRIPRYERDIINMVGMGVTENPKLKPNVGNGAEGFSVTYIRANAESLGRSVNVLCQVRMTRQTVEARAEFEQFIQSRAEIVECYAMSGEWDYLLRIAVKDVADYDRFIMRGVLAHPSVANAASNFALRQVKYTTEIPV